MKKTFSFLLVLFVVLLISCFDSNEASTSPNQELNSSSSSLSSTSILLDSTNIKVIEVNSSSSSYAIAIDTVKEFDSKIGLVEMLYKDTIYSSSYYYRGVKTTYLNEKIVFDFYPVPLKTSSKPNTYVLNVENFGENTDSLKTLAMFIINAEKEDDIICLNYFNNDRTFNTIDGVDPVSLKYYNFQFLTGIFGVVYKSYSSTVVSTLTDLVGEINAERKLVVCRTDTRTIVNKTKMTAAYINREE